MFGKIKIALYIFLVIVISGTTFGQVKDTDSDGITDDAEVQTYHTDPAKFDTDGDSFSDGAEVLNNTDPIDPANSPIINITKKPLTLLRQGDPVAWYIARISGIIAFILLSFVVTFGLIQTSKALVKYRFMSVATALETHRSLAWTGLIAVVLHFSSLLFDDVLRLTLIEALIPFQVARDFKTAQGFSFSVPISLGIFGLYAMVLLIVTSEIRGKIVNMRTWRTIHYISFAGYVMFVIHGFVTGSDSNEPWMRALYIGSLTLNIGLLLARIFKKQLFYPKRPKVVSAASVPPAVKQETPQNAQNSQGSQNSPTSQSSSQPPVAQSPVTQQHDHAPNPLHDISPIIQISPSQS